MRFLRRHKFTLLFLGVLAFCSVMVIRQLRLRPAKHVELREAMILMQTGGYTNEASRLLLRLCPDVEKLSNRQLVEDWQRAVVLVDPSVHLPSNVIYQYYWAVRNEMERRGEGHIERARKLAAEEK